MNVQAERVTVMTDCGPVCGKKQAGKTVFLGIPYGKAERFKAPEPVKWTETRDCTAFGPIAPQPNYRGRKPENFVFAMKGSEDCLNLNVWTTSTDPAAKLPVVFAVHGGAFQVGCNYRINTLKCSLSSLFMWKGELTVTEPKTRKTGFELTGDVTFGNATSITAEYGFTLFNRFPVRATATISGIYNQNRGFDVQFTLGASISANAALTM